MYKEHLLQNIEREIMLLKRLAGMIEEKDLHFKPADKTRNTLELMRYLSSVGGDMIRVLVKNDVTKEEWGKIAEHRGGVTIENFEERLDEQWTAVQSHMNGLTDADLGRNVEMPTKEILPMGSAIIMGPIKWLTAYRLQLFLYLKMNGRLELGTPEAWRIVAATAN